MSSMKLYVSSRTYMVILNRNSEIGVTACMRTSYCGDMRIDSTRSSPLLHIVFLAPVPF